jgi:hypothetical protein
MPTTGNCSGPCFGCAGNVILKGMAGDGKRLVVGFFYHQIRVEVDDVRPGGAGGPIPPPPDPGMQYHPERDTTDHNKVEVTVTVKWPFMNEPKRMLFIMERRWANVVVNRINQINTFNEKFNVRIGELKDDFKVKYTDFKDKFGVKWKK